MSDFLSHLSARVLNSAGSGAIQPRLRARFEPPAPAEPLLADLDAALPAEDGAAWGETPGSAEAQTAVPAPLLRADDTAQGRGPAQAQRDDPDAARRAVQVVPPLAASREDIRTQRAERVGRYTNLFGGDEDARAHDPEIGRLKPAQPDSDPRRAHDAHVERGTPIPPAQQDHDLRRTHDAHVERGTPIPPAQQDADLRRAHEADVGHVAPVPPSQAVDLRLAQEIAAAILPSLRRGMASGGTGPAPGPEAGTARITPRLPAEAAPAAPLQPRLALDLPPAPERAAPPAPTINVSIGRVEVRAAPPAASARPAREKARPGADLEAYLRQRAGGKS